MARVELGRFPRGNAYVLPKKLRITKYKVWMRTVLVLWWVVLFVGIATYARWYVPYLFQK